MANELFYPAGVKLGASDLLSNNDDQSADINFEDLTQFASGDFAPNFAGGQAYAPEFMVTTFDAAKVFELVDPANGGDSDVARDYGAANVDLLYRKAKPRATRYGVGESQHLVYRLTSNGMFVWDSFSVQQNGEVSVRTRVIASLNGANPVLTGLPSQTITAPPDHQGVYTIGKIVIDSTEMDRIRRLEWNNNLRIFKDAAGGETTPNLVFVEQMRPVCRFEVQALAQVNAFGFTGFPIASTFDVYLRKRKPNGINHADNEAVHIRLRATAGMIQVDQVDQDKTQARINAMLTRPSGGGAVFDITRDVAIP